MGHDPDVDVSQDGVEAALFQAFPVKKQKFRKLLFQKVKNQISKFIWLFNLDWLLTESD